MTLHESKICFDKIKYYGNGRTILTGQITIIDLLNNNGILAIMKFYFSGEHSADSRCIPGMLIHVYYNRYNTPIYGSRYGKKRIMHRER